MTPNSQILEYWNRFRQLTLPWLINVLAIFVAVWLVPGIHFEGPGWQLGVIAALFSLINLALRPFLMFLTCPLVLLTFGLFGLVINGILLAITSELAQSFNIRFVVEDFWSALLGGLAISLVSLVLNILSGNNRIEVRVNNFGDPNDPNGPQP